MSIPGLPDFSSTRSPQPNPSQEEKLRMIEFMVDHAAEGIFMVTAKGKILYVNEAAASAFGLSREEVMNLTARDIDPTFRQERMEELWKRYPEQPTLTFESIQKRKDGSTYPTEITLNILPYGNVPMFIVFAKNISERKEDELLKQISLSIVEATSRTDSMPDLIEQIWTEIRNVLNTTTLELILLTGPDAKPVQYYETGNKVTARPVKLSGTLTEWLMDNLKPALLRKSDMAKLGIKTHQEESTAIPAIWLGVPLFSGDKTVGSMSLHHETNEMAWDQRHLRMLEFLASQISIAIQRKLAEEALILSEQHLRESNASKDKFFSIIAHDLRGPFNAIIGFSDLLNTDFDSFDKSEAKSLIKNIHEASVRTFKLLENLLEWSRIQTGRTKPNPENIDLSTIANSNISFLKPLAEEKSIKLFSGIHFGTIAFCDENMITTVIRNLLSNAIKFTPKGGEVRIWASMKEEAVEVVIADTGVGIGEKDIPKLFKLDESFKTPGTAGEQGTGLGLILCHEFIGLNNGKIWVESEPGHGSRFKFTLPKFIF